MGIHDAGLSGYNLRRGATFHFTRFASLDATTSYGRWQLAGVARKYISQAVADLEEVRLCESGSTRASRLARIFQPLIAFKLQQYSGEDKINIFFLVTRLHVLSQFSPTSEAPPDHCMSDEGLGVWGEFSVYPTTDSVCE